MIKENQEIWNRVLGEIETEVSKAIFFTLFKKTYLFSLEGEVITIAAPSAMIIDLLQKRYYQIIKKAIDKQVGFDAKIIFVPRILSSSPREKDFPLFKTDASATIGHLPRVRKDYTFQTMAVSSTNQLAYVSAQTVAKKIGNAYNPLFIYGPVGVGKTHLMQAIANDVYENHSDKRIVYITSEEFTNEVVEAIRTNDTAKMKRRFRGTDVLIIDDVQFIAGKEKVQEELFHTFNTLVDRGSQIVLSSDKPPSEIKKLEKRLSSRFSGGLTVDIEPPDFELRCAILLIKAKKNNFDLSMDAAKQIAEKISDTRGLEGTLLRLITQSQALGMDLSKPLVDKVLNNGSDEGINQYHPDELIKRICEFYKIKQTQLKGEKRDASLVRARQIAMYILRKELNMSYVEIGNILGGRDHTTVIHGTRKIEGLLPNQLISSEIKQIIPLNNKQLVD